VCMCVRMRVCVCVYDITKLFIIILSLSQHNTNTNKHTKQGIGKDHAKWIPCLPMMREHPLINIDQTLMDSLSVSQKRAFVNRFVYIRTFLFVHLCWFVWFGFYSHTHTHIHTYTHTHCTHTHTHTHTLPTQLSNECIRIQ